jgi:hypothetical protein
MVNVTYKALMLSVKAPPFNYKPYYKCSLSVISIPASPFHANGHIVLLPSLTGFKAKIIVSAYRIVRIDFYPSRME